MDLKKGDNVRILDETGSGVVTELRADGTVMVSVDGMDFPYYPQQLVLVNEAPEAESSEETDMSLPRVNEAYSKIILEKEDLPEKKVNYRIRPVFDQNGVREVDLHIDVLVEDITGMSNYKMLKIQLEAARRTIEEAMENRERKVILIHGVGEGVLREELRQMLINYPNVESQDASYRKYGYGATEVIIH